MGINLYLDVCCLNRPFDDQAQNRIRLETEAVYLILNGVLNEEWTWTGSAAMTLEIEQTPDEDRRRRALRFLDLVTRQIPVEQAEIDRAKALQTLGFGALDALHIACAESGKVDVLLTTDDRMMRLTTRLRPQLHVRIANPLAWVQENI